MSLFEDYEIGEEIAVGGFGRIFKAQHKLLDEPACIKQNINESREDVNLLKAEGKLLWRLSEYHSIPGARAFYQLSDTNAALVMSYVEGKTLWVDLKARQLRVATYGVPPFTEIELNHAISVNPGAIAYFSGGRERATVAAVKDNKLIMLEGPKRVVGPGEGVNIPDESLRIKGYLPDMDKRYVEACQNTGVQNYMLSYVESSADVEALKKLDAQAIVVAKIESKKGLEYVASQWNNEARLMAARGDLYLEVGKPHEITNAVAGIVKKDGSAIAASRIFPSLAYSLEPQSQDIGDVDSLLRMGYQTLMLGDEICMERNAVISGLNLLQAMVEAYEP